MTPFQEKLAALKDRIDVTIRAMNFNSRFLPRLLARLEAGQRPTDLVPSDIVFTEPPPPR